MLEASLYKRKIRVKNREIQSKEYLGIVTP